jgi:hypothetical protein
MTIDEAIDDVARRVPIRAGVPRAEFVRALYAYLDRHGGRASASLATNMLVGAREMAPVLFEEQIVAYYRQHCEPGTEERTSEPMTERLGPHMVVEHEPPKPGRETSTWYISARYGGPLGIVSWWGRWRRYTFDPEPGATFGASCLRHIARFLERGARSEGRK